MPNVDTADWLEKYFIRLGLFDRVERVGPTELKVDVWQYDSDKRVGYTVACTLEVKEPE